MSRAATATIIVVVVVVFIRPSVSGTPTAQEPATDDAEDSVAAAAAVARVACVADVVRSTANVVPDTVTPCRRKNRSKVSRAAASSRQATLSEQPISAAEARGVLLLKQ